MSQALTGSEAGSDSKIDPFNRPALRKVRSVIFHAAAAADRAPLTVLDHYG